MTGLRAAAFAVFFAAFVAFAWVGLRGWSSGGAGGVTPSEPAAEADEVPLRTGFLTGHTIGHYGSMGYPWEPLRARCQELEASLPADPAPVDADEAEKKNRIILSELRFTMPAGSVPWSNVVATLKARIEPHGVKVRTGRPEIPDSCPVLLPEQEWTGLSIFGHMMSVTQKAIVYVVTSDGVTVGRDETCNRARREADLTAYRRRVAAELADPALDVEFRPDVVDANIVDFLRGMKAQTGIEVVAEPGVWDMGPALAWRGPPRSLRDALDELCRGFHWYWRWQDGRAWLLKP
jgi:hypothetical protein